MDDRLISPRAAAEHYAVTRVTIYRWIRAGKLSAIKIGGVVRVRLIEPPAMAATAIPQAVPEQGTKPRAAEKARRSEKREPKQARQRRVKRARK